MIPRKLWEARLQGREGECQEPGPMHVEDGVLWSRGRSEPPRKCLCVSECIPGALT